MKKVKTIIIGGGISGLACAKELHDAGEDFLLISKELGGRMLTSKSLTVDYGASYVTSEYKNVLKYVDKGDRLSLDKIYFIQNNQLATVFSIKNLFHFPRLLKIRYLVNDFAKRFSKFRKRSLEVGQKAAIREDKVLKRYTGQSAKDFIKKHKLESLHETFFNPILQSTVFSDIDEASAMYYLGVLIPIARKTYAADFRHVLPRITHGFKNRIFEEKVKSLKKNRKKEYVVTTNKDKFVAKNIVIATPYNFAKKFYDVKSTGPMVPVHVIHVVGKREEVYQNKKVIFFKPEHHDITILWKQHTGSDIVFSKLKNPDLEKYYEYHHVVRNILWRNSLMLSGSVENWVDQELDYNLYLASDYNVCGLEDSFLTGVYAARQIINK